MKQGATLLGLYASLYDVSMQSGHISDFSDTMVGCIDHKILWKMTMTLHTILNLLLNFKLKLSNTIV